MDHFYETIGGFFFFQDAYKRLVQEAPDNSHFVEVGAYKGRSTAFMAVEIINSGKKIKFDVVDHWMGSSEHNDDIDVQNKTLYETFIKNLEPVSDYLTPIRKDSVDAADEYANNSLDLVFIDASHDYDSVNEDIKAWLPKVKPGGYIGGDDYTWSDVRKAVLNNFDEAKVESIGTYPSWLYKKESE